MKPPRTTRRNAPFFGIDGVRHKMQARQGALMVEYCWHVHVAFLHDFDVPNVRDPFSPRVRDHRTHAQA